MPDSLNPLQAVDLEILGEIVSLCERNGLSYYALGGTLLGAVRHRGFIPWDDDIDIVMPRPDYDALLRICEDELSERYVIQNYRTMPDDPAPTYMTRVGRVGTRVSYGVANEAKEMPIWIDVFPLDAMPSNKVLRVYQKYRLLYQRLKFQFSTYEANAHQHKPNRPLHEKALMRFREVTRLGSTWDPVEILAETEGVARRFDYDSEDYFVNLFGAYKFKEMFPKSWFGGGGASLRGRHHPLSRRVRQGPHADVRRLHAAAEGRRAGSSPLHHSSRAAGRRAVPWGGECR